jgi:hypothetical protein
MVDRSHDLLISFGTAGYAAQYCKAGWAAPEAGEAWCIGTKSSMVLPAPSDPATYVMVANLRPNVSNGRLPSQRLTVRVNGVELADFLLARRTVRSWVVPWAIIAGHSHLEVEFSTPDAARPSDFVDSSDRRKLAVAFSSMRLYPDLHESGRTDTFLSGDDPIPIDIATVMAADQISLSSLLVQFESLGQNCEFGLVQRACQAEPLGLLRFSSTPLPQLLNALDARFEGMGAPENINISISNNGREFMVNDKRFGMVYHAWVNTGDMEPEDLQRREVRRVPFLIRKLVEDLELGEKTFVFKGMGAVPEEEVFPLTMAIRRYGPNTLLFINLADAEHKAGTVEVRAPGFLVGYVDRFAPGDNAHDFLLSQWVKVCREAYRFRLAKLALAA